MRGVSAQATWALATESVLANLVEKLPAADTQQASGLRAIPFRVVQSLLNHAPLGLGEDVLEREWLF